MRNEKGYTLVVVLLLITVMFLFSTVIVLSSYSSAKQIEQTETKNMSTQIAEMGITYVKETLYNMDPYDLKDNAMVETEINGIPQQNVDTAHADRKFAVNFDHVDTIDDPSKDYLLQHVFFTSKGEADTKSKTLVAELWAKIPRILINPSYKANIEINPDLTGKTEGSGIIQSGNQVTGVPGEYNEYPGADNYGYVDVKNDSVVIFKGDTTFTNSIQVGEDSTIAVDGDLSMGANFGIIGPNGTVLIAGESKTDNVTLGKNSSFKALSVINGADIQTKDGSNFSVCEGADFKTGTFEGDVQICGESTFANNTQVFNHSTLKIRGNATFKDGVEVRDGSTLNINGNFYSPKNINISDDSLVRVFGDTKFNGPLTFNGNSKLYNYGTFSMTVAGFNNYTATSNEPIICTRKIDLSALTKMQENSLTIVYDTSGMSKCSDIPSPQENTIYVLPDLLHEDPSDTAMDDAYNLFVNSYFSECADICKRPPQYTDVNIHDVEY